MKKSIIAIDPGRTGGVAWRTPGFQISLEPMPSSDKAIAALLKEIVDFCIPRSEYPLAVYLEAVSGYIKPQTEDDEERENRQPAHLMFKFGRNVGVVVGALYSAGIEEISEVYPVTWQKILFLKTRGIEQRERKRMLLEKARQLFPRLEVTMKTADALLLFHYADTIESQNLFTI